MRWPLKSNSRTACLRKMPPITSVSDKTLLVGDWLMMVVAPFTVVLDGEHESKIKLATPLLILLRLIVDGNGWSSRFSRLLMSGSVVIKHTLFPEWHHVRQAIAKLFPC